VIKEVKNKIKSKKIALSISSIVTLVLPIAVAIACGSNKDVK